MEKLRLYVWIALAAILYIAYMMWQQDYPPPQAPASATTPPSVTTSNLPALPGETETRSAAAPTTVIGTAPAVEPPEPAKTITVRTDVLDISISLRGGEFDRADMLKYPLGKEHPNQFVRLFDSTPEAYFVARSGLRAAGESDAPSHQALYVSVSDHYQLAEGQDSLAVPLAWTNQQGITVTKVYTFKRGSYAVGVDYQVANKTTAEWRAASYVQLARRQTPQERSMFNTETYAFKGPAIGDGKSIKKLKLDKDEDKRYSATISGGWLAAMQHHFVAAAVPAPGLPYDYQLTVESPTQFTVAYRGPLESIAPGSSGAFHESIYVGPTLHQQLEAAGPKLELTIDYGWLTIIAGPLFWLLAKGYSVLGNWGWSIIVTTLLIKLAFYKLTEASGKSMARMREMAPRLKALQERYKDNREELGRATMEFYKREKINPLAGCLPMLIQMPVFMAFYWAILNSAEMQQAPFIGYLTDLSSRDPYFILPLLLGIANFVQVKINPAPADPMQAKVMMIMPIMMTGMMVMFPSGLVLYWITNTGLSILQQWHINRVVTGASKKS